MIRGMLVAFCLFLALVSAAAMIGFFLKYGTVRRVYIDGQPTFAVGVVIPLGGKP